MNNLLKIGISQDTIDKMIEINGINLVADLNKNYLIAYNIIDGLRQLFISEENIESLLIYVINLFFMDYNKFINKIKGEDLGYISSRINEDYNEAFNIFLNE